MLQGDHPLVSAFVPTQSPYITRVALLVERLGERVEQVGLVRLLNFAENAADIDDTFLFLLC